jgi:hypothetical protein
MAITKRKKKQAKTERAKATLRRLTEDEEVQAHLRTAALRSREAWSRATRRPGSKAVEDKKLYDKLREAATSLNKAVGSLRQEPEPPKHRGRKVVIVAASAGGAAYALNKRRSNGSAESEQPAKPEPVAG